MRSIPFALHNVLTAALTALMALGTPEGAGASPPVQLVARSSESSGIVHLSWDTGGGARGNENLLRPDTAIVVQTVLPGGQTASPVPFAQTLAEQTTGWTSEPDPDSLTIRVRLPENQGGRIILPFDPKVTPVSVLPSDIRPDRSLALPAILHAPDFGSMLLTSDSARVSSATLVGSREHKIVDLELLIDPGAGSALSLHIRPLALSPPPVVQGDPRYWNLAREGWLNIFQLTSRWGKEGDKFSSPAGLLGNNVISDPVSYALWTYADAGLWIPEPAESISLMRHVRRTLDWWMDEKITSSGECLGYWAYYNFLDANPSLIISAWDYVEATGDEAWLRGRIDQLERLSAFLESRNIDNDGLVEAVQSGNRGTLLHPNRSSNWWDALNCGHKDGYGNAVIYRGWRCLADLESRLNREERAAHYTALADRLQADYRKVLWNPETGWLGWWRSADGELHDYASPVLNGMAIEYGLLDVETGRDVLKRLRRKMEQAGFQRPDLGVPSFLVPVHRSDYLLPDGLGVPTREDGTDTFGHYMNGGITAGHSLHWLVAHYRVGEADYADKFLAAMLERQKNGKFQNGVTDSPMKGIDWTDWEGRPCGYEGYLSDNYRFLQAVMLRHPELRERFYKPLFPSRH